MKFIDAKSQPPQIVRIEKLGVYGEGIGRNESGDVFFVPLSALGDVLEVQPIKRKKQYVEARIIKIIEASADRQDPQCSLFGSCGGCQLQHMSYESQVAYKQQLLQHQIQKYLGCEMEVGVRASQTPYGYRRRVRMRQKAGRVGYFGRGTHSFIAVDQCAIAHEGINAWLAAPRHFPRPESHWDISLDVQNDGTVRAYEGPAQSHMGFRQANADGELAIQELLQSHMMSVNRGVLELYAGEGTLVLPWFQLTGNKFYLGVDADPVNVDKGRQRYGKDRAQFEVGTLPAWLLRREIQDPAFLSQFDVMVLDPPRSGMGSDIKLIQTLKSIPKIIYVSCDLFSWIHDTRLLQEVHGFKLQHVVMVDMFPQTRHFEVFSVLEK